MQDKTRKVISAEEYSKLIDRISRNCEKSGLSTEDTLLMMLNVANQYTIEEDKK